MSAQKYAPTATSVPRCSATSKVWLKRSFSFRYVQSAAQGTDQVPGGRDRQELGEPLDEAEHERLGIRERGRIVTACGEREHERETERRPRDAVHERAAHPLILRGGNDVSPTSPYLCVSPRTAKGRGPRGWGNVVFPKNSPSRWRFRPLNLLTVRFRVEPSS